jgi:phosphate transport system substrate-binding protein
MLVQAKASRLKRIFDPPHVHYPIAVVGIVIMRAAFAKSAIVFLLAGALPVGNAAAADTLRLGGTGTANGMLRQVGAEFTAADGGKVEVVASLGSTGAIRALADGVIDIAVSARPLKADEAAAGLRQVAVLRTAYVIATSHSNPNGLKSADLARIFAAEKPTWADGTPIRILLRPRSDTDMALLGQLFAGMDKAIEAARRRAEVPIAATDQDNIALAERTPGSLDGTTATQIKTEHRNLHVVPLDGVEPTLANFESGAYRFAKKLYFIVPRNSTPEAQRFVDFLRSSQGVKALRETEILPGTE